jgi:hypothetical protein
MTTTDPLRDATRAYVEAAFALIRAQCEPGPDEQGGLYGWERASNDTFRLAPKSSPWWHSCVRVNRDDLHALPECSRLVGLLKSDPEVAPLLVEMVGYMGSARQLQSHEITDRLIWTLGASLDRGELTVGAFNAAYAASDAELRSTRVPEIAIARCLVTAGQKAGCL